MIRIAIVDTQAEYKKKLGEILASQDDFTVIGWGKDGYEAITIAARHKPDILFLDIDLPYADGITTASIVKSRSPSTSVIVFCNTGDYLHIFDAFANGVSGCLTKAASPDFLYHSIRTVYCGGTLISPEIAEKAGRIFSGFVREQIPRYMRKKPQSGFPKKVSLTELDIMGCIGKGLTNREIAEKLQLREGTVRNYVSSVLQKTGLHDRTQVAIYAIKAGL